MTKGFSMPRYWLLCLSEDNYEIARRQGLIGMSERAGTALRHISLGDMLAFDMYRKQVCSGAVKP